MTEKIGAVVIGAGVVGLACARALALRGIETAIVEAEAAIGTEISALVKSSSVLLLNDPSVKTSARNQLWGEITRIHDGPVNSEVTLTLKSGKSVCAVLTRDSVERLGLAVGGRACALFKASAVILCKYS